MALFPLSDISYRLLKKALRQTFPEVRSTHMDEALARAIGYRTYAAYLVANPPAERDSRMTELDVGRFASRLVDFGYSPESQFQAGFVDTFKNVFSDALQEARLA
jgi:hypothetical protein